MTKPTQQTILILGGPDAGKTHFGGQLYGHLQVKKNFYRITNPPEDLTVFKEVLDSLSDGKAAGHTQAGANHVTVLELVDPSGGRLSLTFPDYGGEQVNAIVEDHRVYKVWKDLIDTSGAWVLFIRVDTIPPLEDVSNRGIPGVEVLERRKWDSDSMILSQPAFYMELVQILLYVKRSSIHRSIVNPRLTVVLSCWDIIAGQYEGQTPEAVLIDRLPALHYFLRSNWAKDAFQVIGISSTERSLSNSLSDKDYVIKGPEQFGYIVTPNGEIQRDLTLSIAAFIGTFN